MIDADFTEEPKKEVNYKDRALRGALIGALLGGGLGGSIGLGKGVEIGSTLDSKDFEDRFPSPEYPYYRDYVDSGRSREEYNADMAKYEALTEQHWKDRAEHHGHTKGLIGGGLGALLGAGLGAGVGAGAGALQNMFTGYANEDLITQSEPNTARKALLMGLLGAASAGTLGAATRGLEGGLIGGGLGAGAGALAAVMNDYLNRDFYGPEKKSAAINKETNRNNQFQKQALIGTLSSALVHGAAADDNEPILRELLRGGAKGFGADLGMLAGAVGGAGLGAGIANRTGGDDPDNIAGGIGLGGLVGVPAGGILGYILADKLIDNIGKKQQKTAGVLSAYSHIKTANNIKQMLRKQAMVKSAVDIEAAPEVAKTLQTKLPAALDKNYVLNDALIGGGVGALGGGLAGALKEYLSDKAEKEYLKNILGGGAIGLGLGGIAGAGYGAATGDRRAKDNVRNLYDIATKKLFSAPIGTARGPAGLMVFDDMLDHGARGLIMSRLESQLQQSDWRDQIRKDFTSNE